MQLIKPLAIAQAIFLIGCSQPKVENKIVIPKQLLTAPVIDTSKEPKTDKEIALFMLDIYEAYEKCAINLKSINKILDAQNRG